VRFSSVVFPSGACAWATPFTLATLSSWRRFLLATPSLGDALFLGDACRRFEQKKDKD